MRLRGDLNPGETGIAAAQCQQTSIATQGDREADAPKPGRLEMREAQKFGGDACDTCIGFRLNLSP
ncbi:hypothetical protein GCM10009069_30050 [Algimonas arctica]|uniref:Uncharacterized protein n=1 Tax=Algimonas arctica TaxID=1479486 RepID=A0A8J3CT09_9PROT|nr:hypothetical protein GCM10009069_30050 [Algimonas arctica]